MPACSVTFDPTASPMFSFNLDPIPVPYGNNQTITWTLISPKAAGAHFDATNGVAFKPNSGWSGAAPSGAGNSPTVFTVIDNNTNPGTLAVDYPYSVNVVYNNQTYTYDPEVANDPKGNPTVRYHPA